MKTVINTICIFLSALALQAQSTIMPAHTKAAIEVISADLGSHRNIPSQKVLDFYPIYRTQGKYQIAVLCKVNDQFDKAQAMRDGLDVGAVIGKIASMRMPVEYLTEAFSYPGIEYLEVAEKIHPELDGSLVDAKVNLVHQGIDLPQAYTGKDVLIGIVDWGFDYTHPTFYDTSLNANRILAAWDQEKVMGTPPDGFSHGAVYTDADQLAAAQSDTVSNTSSYHGTHVAGIAAGSGGGTIYRGAGFESNLLFSQMRRDASSSLDAFQWMYNVAQAEGKRLVINNSWGSYRTNPLDGTSLISQAIDEMTELGVVFVFSAANNGGINFHLKKTFDHDSVRTRVMGFDYASDGDLWGQTVSMWGEAGHPFTIQYRVMNSSNEIIAVSEFFNTNAAPAYVDTFFVIDEDTVFYNVTTDAAHPLNNRPQMTLNLRHTNTSFRSIIYAAAESGTLHMWNSRYTIFGGGNTGKGFTAPVAGYALGDRNYGIGHPGLTSRVITTAAHITNSGLASFTSYGPRMDELPKPDISAPGQDILSALNSFAPESFIAAASTTFNGKEYEFVRLSGTSMSAPMVTGIVSLILQADPTLHPTEIKTLLRNTAREDNHTGAIDPEGHVRWGQGKADAHAALLQLLDPSATANFSADRIQIYPNPASDELRIEGDLNGNELFTITDLFGRIVMQGVIMNSISISALPNGLYFLTIPQSVLQPAIFVKE
jgi:minor extracellular serine protease Vpr